MHDVMKRSLQSVGLVIVGTLVGGGALGRPAGAAVGFDWALIGNSGNAADTLVMDKGPAADYTTGYGAVGYDTGSSISSRRRGSTGIAITASSRRITS
jgi:hypothetical protein